MHEVRDSVDGLSAKPCNGHQVEPGQGFQLGDRVQSLIAGAISGRQRAKHRRWMAQLHQLQTPLEFVTFLENLRIKRKWKWSTTKTAMGEMVGALQRAELYGNCRLKDLLRSAIFKDYQRRVRKCVMSEEVKFPKPLSSRQVERILKQMHYDKNRLLMVALVLCWATASRVACVLKLRAKNVFFEPDGVRIRFVEGKGVFARRQPYTVHTILGKWHENVRRWIAHCTGEFLFPQDQVAKISNALRVALRAEDPDLELRSVRRGALTTMAERGTPLEVLRHFSGHTNDEMLLRYLGWGWSHGNMMKRGRKAAHPLW